MSDQVTLTLDGALGIITLNRPEAANALSTDVMEAIIAKAQAVGRETAVRVVILTGTGKHFCGGADLREARQDGNGLERRRRARLGGELLRALRAIPQITICAVEGAAMGGGACMATACDFRIAAENARFAYPEIDRGMNLQWGGLALCLRLIGPSRTKQMVGSGDPYGVQKLESWGFVDEVTAPGEALDEALRWAERYAAKPPLALQMIKESVNALSDALDSAIMHMDSDQWALTAQSEDYAEGMAAFREGRTPHFTGN
ncbi:MAG: enoyl-CoA hydratase/isomerase family protein [Proteobacteria bacterium]|jgi:enoyl-CoA hydratase|nr:enoyl-CoA hydratase/isomerase family protein [Pseudomonadota bacterium]